MSPVKSLYWEQFPSMSQRRVYCTPVYHDGLLYVLGGCSETGMPLDSVEVLDVESQTWSQLPPLPTARAGASAVALGGQVMVLGGMNQQQTPLASVEMYHPDEGKWETKSSLGQPSMGVTTVEKGKKVECMCVALLLIPNVQVQHSCHWGEHDLRGTTDCTKLDRMCSSRGHLAAQCVVRFMLLPDCHRLKKSGQVGGSNLHVRFVQFFVGFC